MAFGLGYWDGMPEKDSGQRAEVVAPTIITNVVTNTLREVVTNIVRVPAPLPVKPNPIVEKAIRSAAKKPTGELTQADLEKVITLCAWIKPERVGKGKSGWQQIYKKQA